MAEAKSAAKTRKPAARRTTGTRKVAAKTTPKVETKAVVQDPSPEAVMESMPREYTEEERQGLLTSYTALKSAGLPVPDNIAQPVEEWIRLEERRREIEAAERALIQEAVEVENATGPWYVRNGYSGAPLSLRLERQTERKRIELKPRGIPGDMHPLQDSDLNDDVLKQNVRIGVCEIIPAGEANRIIDQQTTNVQSRVHTPTAILRNAEGKEYKPGAVKTEIEYGARGITVGTVDPGQIQGQFEDKAVANAQLGGIVRTKDAAGNPIESKPEVASQFIPTGGNPYVVQTGPAPQGDVPQLDIAKAKIADDLARRTGNGNPLAGMRVTINPTSKA
jgi:hypothetical protein